MANELSKVERDEIAKQAAGRPVTYVAPAAVLLLGAFTGLLLPAIVLAIVAFFISMGVQVDRASKKRTGAARSRARAAGSRSMRPRSSPRSTRRTPPSARSTRPSPTRITRSRRSRKT